PVVGRRVLPARRSGFEEPSRAGQLHRRSPGRPGVRCRGRYIGRRNLRAARGARRMERSSARAPHVTASQRRPAFRRARRALRGDCLAVYGPKAETAPMIVDVGRFQKREQPYWDEMGKELDALEKDATRELPVDRALRLHHLYRRTASDLNEIRSM